LSISTRYFGNFTIRMMTNGTYAIPDVFRKNFLSPTAYSIPAGHRRLSGDGETWDVVGQIDLVLSHCSAEGRVERSRRVRLASSITGLTDAESEQP
jgi:hypothetical protein